MFLKRIEVKGFKSFGEPIQVDFVQGVTAVVGPNGSGKSNIADGIRWVLGEQSARSLRGAKMEDVIFAGSDTRKAVNVAEVSLILDNEDEHLAIDYSEVRVTRRLYRSGESEYLLNGTTCRLKDITDLFLDSGLGREAYSIIGQGKIEEILSSKAEQRRLIFEEAAGVLKYKTRKLTAEKRLNQTEENLHRVNDILNELEDQVEPLREQAAVAKEYNRLKEELEQLDVQVITEEISHLHTEWESQSLELANLKTLIEKQRTQLASNEEELETIRQQQRSSREKSSDVQQRYLQISEELEKNEGRKGILEEKQRSKQKDEEQSKQALAQKQEEKDRLALKKAELEKENETLTQKSRAINEAYQKLEKTLSQSKETIAAHIEDAKGDYIEWLNEQASLRNERRYLNEQVEQKQRYSDKNQSELASLDETLLEGERELKKQKAELDAIQSKVEKQKEELYALRETEESEKEALFKKETKLYEAYKIMQKVDGRREALQEMEEDFSGFFQGVKEVLKQRNRLTGVIGAVAELIHVPQRVEKAIDIALGGQAQHVIVEDDAAARAAIGYLRDQRAGRATFLPVKTIKPRVIPEAVVGALSREQGFVSIASDAVSVNESYQHVIQSLLGTTIIVEELKAANRIAKQFNHRYRLVTLEGDVVNPGGSMTGGSVKQNQSSLISRKREKEELDEKKAQLDEAIASLEQQVATFKTARDEKQGHIQVLQEKESALVHDYEQIKQAYQSKELEVTQLKREHERLERLKASDEQEGDVTKKRLSDIEQAEQRAVQESAQLEKKIEELQLQLDHEQVAKEKARAELTELKVQRAEIRQQLNYNQSQLEETTRQFEQVVQALELEVENYQLLHSSSGEQTLTKESLTKLITDGTNEKASLAKQLDLLNDEETKYHEKYERLGKENKHNQEELETILTKSQTLEVRVNRLDVDLDYRLNRLREEYELSYEGAKQRYPMSETLDEAKKKLTLTRRSIEELGVINLGAIDEYERINGRYQFLTAQRTDLLDARQSLDQAIEEMDEEMSKRFMTTFARIRTHFQEVFVKLFGGGDADLILTDENAPLTTGIDIVARPPGKKKQQLGLLSGGERALTAIALLFAILQVRPVPFCVLDEVEAALDEANVSRFAQYLRDFSTRTQFIVVTHRKGTMEGADVLYGVTMEESGVSRVVSVRLEESRQMIES
ncbi:chromosome segregation protein SMC [Bacillus sp. Marseille-P3800]|uniref:chromosome segregation protein SMC n=1 Tax=Bacillus sp. Marseille-P3800 TaxID=2014782 RepID=UPI000C071D21|nr:chromosome segregation protein SMC [Bacillus sp. Marseille-P3800]